MWLKMYTKYAATRVCSERMHYHILRRRELRWRVGVRPCWALCFANGKAPHQKPGVIVGHLHSYSNCKTACTGFPSRKTSKAISTQRREDITPSLIIGFKVCVQFRSKMIYLRNCEHSFSGSFSDPSVFLLRRCFGVVADQQRSA